ncbi:UNVERIFIED_CONTAM: alkylhydroperoxidase family enzyme [Williamsia faeni]
MSDSARLPPVAVEHWTESTRTVLEAHLRRPELYTGPDARPMPNVLGLLANQVPIGAGWLAFNNVLATESTIDDRLRELIVLRVSWLTRSAYGWNQHQRLGLLAGLTEGQLESIADGPTADLWDAVERAVLVATDQMVERHTVDDQAWATLSDHFSPSQLLELLFVAGSYLCFAVICNAADLRPDQSTAARHHLDSATLST